MAHTHKRLVFWFVSYSKNILSSKLSDKNVFRVKHADVAQIAQTCWRLTNSLKLFVSTHVEQPKYSCHNFFKEKKRSKYWTVIKRDLRRIKMKRFIGFLIMGKFRIYLIFTLKYVMIQITWIYPRQPVVCSPCLAIYSCITNMTNEKPR